MGLPDKNPSKRPAGATSNWTEFRSPTGANDAVTEFRSPTGANDAVREDAIAQPMTTIEVDEQTLQPRM
ncbi:hypothetical protein AB0I35_12980 [Nocardia sp. NPDC050378]|uniref:hypothetical protein n=1 Tax=Nocardia sp. NPDC050378 TaxID=3155400 RepID=UPI0033E5E8ED